MSPNLVLQQLISDQNSTLPPNMPISIFEASMVNCQWSMVNTFVSYIKWICTTNILSPQFTAMQHHKWAWTASHPTQRPAKPPSTVPTLPEEQPLYQYHPGSHCRWACCRPEWWRACPGVGAESKKGKWAEQLGRRWEKKSTFTQCLRMVVKVFVVERLFYSFPL